MQILHPKETFIVHKKPSILTRRPQSVVWCFRFSTYSTRLPNSQNATAEAAATFRESTLFDIGIRTT